MVAPGGVQTTSPADQFIYVAAPAVANVSPATGTTGGGTTVTITGTSFTGATAVDFGTTAASNVVINPAGTQITATSPQEPVATVDVTVIGPGGTSATLTADQFTYVPLLSTWISASDDTWNLAANWSDNLGTGAPGEGASSGATAIFNGGSGTELTADIGSTSPNIAALDFGTSALNYTIESSTGFGQLQMNNGSGTATMTVSTGTQTISAPLLLGSKTLLDAAASTTLDVSGTVTGNAALTVGDATHNGTVVLSGANSYTGGTTLNAGALLAENTTGSATGAGSVTLNGGTLGSSTTGIITGTVVGGSAAHTIEPGGATVGSLTVGGLTANANTTLEFNLGSGGTSSLLTLGSGGMTETAAVPITVGTLPASPAGFYKIITGDITGLTAASFVAPPVANGDVL